MNLYQLYSKEFKDEKFCFNAIDLQDAEKKKMKWVSYHGFLPIKDNFCVKQIEKPYYEGNIHNDWIK